uniref:Uncharacterized protein n=1 Tax=Rhizophora mucronata TaxID=61149 RepID=A0A2P2PNA4_RHIMU
MNNIMERHNLERCTKHIIHDMVNFVYHPSKHHPHSSPKLSATACSLSSTSTCGSASIKDTRK